MIGKLDPEENVLDDKLTFRGARKSKQILYNQDVVGKISSLIESLGWECYDDVVVELVQSSQLMQWKRPLKPLS